MVAVAVSRDRYPGDGADLQRGRRRPARSSGPEDARPMTCLLEVENLVVHFDTDGGLVEVLDDVNFTMHAGEILGRGGESGSGKSVSAIAILSMIRRPGRILAGSIRFEGIDLLRLSEVEMRKYRGRRRAMIPQSHRTALNPVISAGRQISRLFEIHEGCSRAAARRRALEL